jgi:hypothetical protein
MGEELLNNANVYTAFAISGEDFSPVSDASFSLVEMEL